MSKGVVAQEMDQLNKGSLEWQVDVRFLGQQVLTDVSISPHT